MTDTMNGKGSAVATMRERPYGHSNFLVDLGSGDARAPTAGFCEVVFPEFRTGPKAQEQTVQTGQHADVMRPGDTNYLLLKRGATGSLDLYDWWNKARRGKAPKRRTLKIELLGEDHATVVMTWRFFNARPVTLAYSPLRANEGGILIETLTVAFERMEMQ